MKLFSKKQLAPVIEYETIYEARITVRYFNDEDQQTFEQEYKSYKGAESWIQKVIRQIYNSMKDEGIVLIDLQNILRCGNIKAVDSGIRKSQRRI